MKKWRVIAYIFGIAFMVSLVSCVKKVPHKKDSYRYTRNDLLRYCYELIEDNEEELTALTNVFFENSPKSTILYDVDYYGMDQDKGIYLIWYEVEDFGYYPPEEIIQAYFNFCQKNGYLNINDIRILEGSTIGLRLPTAFDETEEKPCGCWLVRGDLNLTFNLDTFYKKGITKKWTTSARLIRLSEEWTFVWFVDLSDFTL